MMAETVFFWPKYTISADQIHFDRIFGFGQNSVFFSNNVILVLVFRLKICSGCPLVTSYLDIFDDLLKSTLGREVCLGGRFCF